LNGEGVPDGVKFYITESGAMIEPQAIILSILIFVAAVSLVLSVLSLFTGKEMGRKVVSLFVIIAAVGAIAMFIYTYEIAVDGNLWAHVNGFLLSILTMQIFGSFDPAAFGGFAVFTSYLLVAGLGITSYVVSLINK
jgi:hypothetical protein